jgi:hypothetical protein
MHSIVAQCHPAITVSFKMFQSAGHGLVGNEFGNVIESRRRVVVRHRNGRDASRRRRRAEVSRQQVTGWLIRSEAAESGKLKDLFCFFKHCSWKYLLYVWYEASLFYRPINERTQKSKLSLGVAIRLELSLHKPVGRKLGRVGISKTIVLVWGKPKTFFSFEIFFVKIKSVRAEEDDRFAATTIGLHFYRLLLGFSDNFAFF